MRILTLRIPYIVSDDRKSLLDSAANLFAILRGYVQAHVSDIGRDDGVVFLCGQKHMVEEAGRMLALVGVGKERIFLNV